MKLESAFKATGGFVLKGKQQQPIVVQATLGQNDQIVLKEVDQVTFAHMMPAVREDLENKQLLNTCVLEPPRAQVAWEQSR